MVPVTRGGDERGAITRGLEKRGRGGTIERLEIHEGSNRNEGRWEAVMEEEMRPNETGE